MRPAVPGQKAPVRSKAGFIARRVLFRLGGMVIVVWGAATAAFLVLQLVPGDPVDVMLGIQGQASPEVKDAIRSDLGLDQPVWVQYFGYLGRLLSGNLGTSYQLRLPVTEVIGQQLGPTVQLAALSLAFALILALAGALLAQGRALRSVFSLFELVAISSPPFWIGLVLLALFAFGLHWFPVAGANGFAALVLPSLTIALPVAGILGQVLRTGLEAAEAQPFATTARARGIRPTRLVLRHTLRHAAVPTLTLTGYIVGSLLGGAVIVESVFARPGLGRVTLAAITNRDLPVVMGIIVLTSVVFVVVNLIVDLAYELIDPRITLQATAIGEAR
jgi:peptide/nickel transport system permease protein